MLEKVCGSYMFVKFFAQNKPHQVLFLPVSAPLRMRCLKTQKSLLYK